MNFAKDLFYVRTILTQCQQINYDKQGESLAIPINTTPESQLVIKEKLRFGIQYKITVL